MVDPALECSWFEDLMMDDAPATGQKVLRERGGGSAVTLAPVEAPVLPSDSCVPAGFEWVTQLPPPRLKRSRKNDPTATEAAASLTEALDTPTPSPKAPSPTLTSSPKASPRSQRRASWSSSSRRGGGSAGRANRKSNSTAASEPATQGTPTLAPSAAEMEGSAGTLADELSGDLGFSSFNDLDVSVDDLAEFKLPLPCPVGPVSDKATTNDFDVALHTASFGAHEPPAVESSYKKSRHNLTERKRVDRLNQLFNRLSAAIDDEEDELPGAVVAPAGKSKSGKDSKAQLAISETSEDPLNPVPKKDRSKAEVLETALQVILHLRKQLNEERLARRLGVADLEDATPQALDPAAITKMESEGDAASAEGDGSQTDYTNVDW